MAEKDFVRRTGDVRIKLAPEMRERLDVIAQAYGFPLATMAAVAVAEWVNSKEQNIKNQKMMVMDVGRQVSGQMADLLNALAESPEMSVAAEEVVKKVQGGSLLLGGKEVAGG